MPAQERNEWQEAEEDEEADLEYGSEAAGQQEDSRASAHRAKRRKLIKDSEGEEEENAGDSDGDGSNGDHGGLDGTAPAGILQRETAASTTRQTPKVLTPAALKSSMAASKKTGVVYLSRVPPFMKPQKVKQLLSRFGTVGRVFLQPEDPASYARRKRFGGNKKRNFEDGWVEFADKKVAKLVVETLNATTIGGKKGNYYHDDVWNMKYLKGFKWHHLTEQIANENAERAARLRTDISRTNRENKLFVRNVERAKMLENIEAKRKGKRDKESDGPGGGAGAVHTDEPQQRSDFKRHFRQNEVRKKGGDGGDKQSEEVQRVLSKIF
ncbi:MAG: RNA-binding ATPase activator esf2 [Geoglossum umbratile]|nr:MAG: RNA-binding ATPase activator esf2 [Geoglossum umbratile]